MDKKDPKVNRIPFIALSKIQDRYHGSILFGQGEIIGEPFRSG